jgi:YVTN family beta-propeller protein
MAANGVQVFIVNQGDGTATNPGSVSVIDTNSDVPIPCTPGTTGCNATTGAISVGTAPATSVPNFAFYDTRLQRLYVTNTGEPTVSVIKADGINLDANPKVLPGLLANISISSASGAPTSVVALSDGSKAYAAMGGCPSGTNHTNLVKSLGSCAGHEVAVIDAIALRQAGATIPVDAGAVSIDASADGSRVYVVGAQAGTVSVISTSSNSVTTKFSVPQQNPSCTGSCLLQTPFSVRVFTQGQ